MKFLTILILTTITTLTFLNAQTTMCFKENHKKMSTIDDTKLDGGLCSSTKTAKDMQKDAWKIDDIKVDKTTKGFDYIYIFKKDEIKYSKIDEAALEAKILARLETKKIEEIKKSKIEKRYIKSESGKKRYLSKCQSCHGQKGEINAKGLARPLKDLTLEEFRMTIRDYMLGTYNRGMAYVMMPYAKIVTDNDVKNIYMYLQSINQNDKNKEIKEDTK